MPNWLTTAEVAERLKFSPATVREMIRRGELRAERWGRQWRVREEALSRDAEQPKPADRKKSKRVQEELARARELLGLSPAASGVAARLA
jgi:excisionase family DNA binding protein